MSPGRGHMNGRSGAKIEIIDEHTFKKTGPGEMVRGIYAQMLGIGPEIFDFDLENDGYYMRRAAKSLLDFEAVGPAGYLAIVASVLSARVWSRDCYLHEWERPFKTWMLVDAPWLNGIFTDRTMYPPCLIHGDPTWENCLLNEKGGLLLTDPLPPGGKIPPFREVDIGKMLQSALGWEHFLGKTKHPPLEISLALDVVQENSRTNFSPKGAVFWTAVHFARIIPYTKSAIERQFVTAKSKEIAEYVAGL